MTIVKNIIEFFAELFFDKISAKISSVLLGILFFVILPIYTYSTEKESIVEIKKITLSPGDNSKYLIFTKEHDVFKNTDTIYRLKFNSSSIQAELDEGAKYLIRYYGLRVPFFSMYPNIYEIKKQNN